VPETFGTCSGRRKGSFCDFLGGLVRSKVILIPKTNESDSAAGQIHGSFRRHLAEFLISFENAMEVIPYLIRYDVCHERVDKVEGRGW
jgi:hypothetical protein